jgi:hypothetical protein
MKIVPKAPTAKQRQTKSATGDGRFPIANRQQALAALQLRGHNTTAAQRSAIIDKAAKYAPAEAKQARAADKVTGRVER